MMGATLSSDHVNYLIWRYLQERGYGRSAVQLMRDWNSDPEKLPFATTVKPHTLVSVLQDGLWYDELISESLARDSSGQRPDRQIDPSDDPRRYAFVERRKRRASDSADDSRAESGHKRPRWQTNGSKPVSTESITDAVAPRPVRRKVSNAHLHINGDSMLVDETEPPVENIKSATPEVDVEMLVEMQVEEPEPPIKTTLMVGQSIGIQNDIQLKPLAHTAAEMIVPGATVFHVHWNASDPAKLLIAGEKLWRSWNVPSTLASTDEEAQELDYEDHAKDGVSLVTATSIAPSGEFFATAIQSEISSEILLQTRPKPIMDNNAGNNEAASRVEITQRPTVLPDDAGLVLALRWNSLSSCLLALGFDEESVKLSTYSMPGLAPYHNINAGKRAGLDATWVSEDRFLVCGHGYISLYSVTPTLYHLHTLSTPESWDYVRWDPVNKIAALIAPEGGRIALVELYSPPSDPQPQSQPLSDSPSSPNGNADAETGTTSENAITTTPTITTTIVPSQSKSLPSRLKIIHTALQSSDITAAEWQPLPLSPIPIPTTTRLLAVSSIDGNLRIWNATPTSLQCLHSSFMGYSPQGSDFLILPTLTLAFSPDGVYVAGAGQGRVCVWRASLEGKAVCVWDEEEVAAVAVAEAKAEEVMEVEMQETVDDGTDIDKVTPLPNGHAESTTTTATTIPSAPTTLSQPPPQQQHQQQHQHQQHQNEQYHTEDHALVHSLSWHPLSNRIAFGRGARITVIDLDLPID